MDKIDDALINGATARPMTEAEEMAYLRQVEGIAAESLEIILGPVYKLEEKPDVRDLRQALQSVVDRSKGLAAVDLACLRSELQSVLKDRKVAGAAGLVKAVFSEADAEQDKAFASKLIPTEPCSHPVDGAKVLDSIESMLLRFAILPEGASVAITLWIVHTYLIGVLFFTPRLLVSSPVKRCGKSTVLTILQELADKAMVTSSITAASLFRAMDKYAPTIIADEADCWMRDNEELRGVVNTGFGRANAYIHRCAGDDHELQSFATFGAMAIAGIGRLPDTVQDRSIVIPMRRKRAGETVEKFRYAKLVAMTAALKPQIARFAADIAELVREAEPSMPRLNDRAADCWEPLLAIADEAGPEWGRRARKAAVILTGADQVEDEDTGVMLLADIREIFEKRSTDRLRTEVILSHLHEMEERPWSEWSKGKPMSPRGLASQLRPFGIAPKAHRNSLGDVSKGYSRPLFDDAFERYLGHPVTEETEKKFSNPSDRGILPVTTLHPNNGKGLRSVSIGYTGESVTDRKHEETAPLPACNGVTDKNTQNGTLEKNLSVTDRKTAWEEREAAAAVDEWDDANNPIFCDEETFQAKTGRRSF